LTKRCKSATVARTSTNSSLIDLCGVGCRDAGARASLRCAMRAGARSARRPSASARGTSRRPPQTGSATRSPFHPAGRVRAPGSSQSAPECSQSAPECSRTLPRRGGCGHPSNCGAHGGADGGCAALVVEKDRRVAARGERRVVTASHVASLPEQFESSSSSSGSIIGPYTPSMNIY